ncbi:MAG: GumC family protein [Terracidiphilus sp.]
MESVPEKELTLRDLLLIFRRRRAIAYTIFCVVLILAGLYCAVCTRRYEAKGVVQVQKESADAMGLESLMSSAGGASDALDANITLQTQANILQSDTLALRTIQDLNLESTRDFQRRWNPLGAILGLFSPKGIADPANASLEDSPQRRARLLKIFAANLKVKPVGGTRLIEIDYLNPDPRIAAAVVNKLTQSLVDYTFQTRYNATNQASQWLGGQLEQLRQNSEDLQSKVVELQKQSGVYSIGTVDAQGREQAYSGVLDDLQQATLALNVARQNCILKGAIAHAAETGDAEMLSGLAGNSIGVNSASTNNSLTLIQSLRQQQGTQQAALSEMESKFGSNYPKIADLKASVEGMEKAVRQEVSRLKGRAQSDYQVAQQTEATTERQYNQAKAKADTLNDKAIEYTIVRQEAEQSRGLYEDLLKRLKEAGVLEGLKSSNITVVDPGRVPAKPQKPNIPLYMAIAVGCGAFLGCLGALLSDTLDNKINTIAEVEEIVGHRLLGATPMTEIASTGDMSSLATLRESKSTYSEAMRSIRTAMLLLGKPVEKRCQVVLTTSSIASEGKTTFTSNLAVVLAQSKYKVLLVDMDMRRGTLRHRLAAERRSGLSGLLAHEGEQATPFSPISELPGLHVILSGSVPPNPSELLQAGMGKLLAEWRERYDFVLLDAPPVLPVTDAVIVNPMADITLMLTRVRMTERGQVRQAYHRLTENGKHYTGVILNGLQPRDESYYGYYGYKKYGYYYGEESYEKRS